MLFDKIAVLIVACIILIPAGCGALYYAIERWNENDK